MTRGFAIALLAGGLLAASGPAWAQGARSGPSAPCTAAQHARAADIINRSGTMDRYQDITGQSTEALLSLEAAEGLLGRNTVPCGAPGARMPAPVSR